MPSFVPHKVIFFGEHAVVYGYPSISSTVDLFSKIHLIPNRFHYQQTPFVQSALKFLNKEDVYVKVESNVPSGSGLGTSSMVIVGILMHNPALRGEKLAREAYEIEYSVQGLGSPIDTSTIVAGGFVMTNGNYGIPLWEITKNDKRWKFTNLPGKNLDLMIVYVGSKGSTKEQVEKVRKFMNRGRFAKEIMERIGEITREGASAIVRNDLEKIGELMKENHRELKIFGLSTPTMDKVIEIGNSYGYGAKLTGAGGGGSVIIIPEDREKIREKLKELNLQFFETSTTSVGAFFK